LLIQNGAGDTQDSLDWLGKSVLDIADKTGISSAKIADGWYKVASAGFRGADAFNIMQAAAESAAIQGANISDVADLLTTVIKNYGTTVYDAIDYTNGFITAVSMGKISFQDFSTAISPLVPLAHQYGFALQDVEAALSMLTNVGYQAAQASTGLRYSFTALELPTAKLINSWQEAGITQQQMTDSLNKGLIPTYKTIYDAALKYGVAGSDAFNVEVMKLTGSGQKQGAMIAFLVGHYKDLEAEANRIADAENKHAEAIIGWNTAAYNLNLQLDRVKEGALSLAIALGEKLLPIVTPVVKGFADWLNGAREFIDNLNTDKIKNFVDNGITFLKTALADVTTWFSPVIDGLKNIWAQLQSPEVAAAAANIFKTLGDTFKILAPLLAPIPSLIGAVLSSINVAGVLDFVNAIATRLEPVLQSVVGVMQKVGQVVGDALANFANTGAINTLSQAFLDFMSTLGPFAEILGGVVGEFLNMLAQSGVLEEFFAMLARGLAGVIVIATGVISSFEELIRLIQFFVTGDFSENAFTALGSDLIKYNDQLIKSINNYDLLNIQLDNLGNNSGPLSAATNMGVFSQSTTNANGNVNTLNNNLKQTPIYINGVRQAWLTLDGTQNKVLGDADLGLGTVQHDMDKIGSTVMKPGVDTSSITNAESVADNLKRKFDSLNGSSTWSSYLNTYQTTYFQSVTGAPGSSIGNPNALAAGGMITEPVVGFGLRTGQMWSFGESGNEMVVPLTGARSMLGASSQNTTTGGDIHVHVEIGGREVMQAILSEADKTVRARYGNRSRAL
jgi:TP901 family phage tail tape measure protein